MLKPLCCALVAMTVSACGRAPARPSTEEIRRTFERLQAVEMRTESQQLRSLEAAFSAKLDELRNTVDSPATPAERIAGEYLIGRLQRQIKNEQHLQETHAKIRKGLDVTDDLFAKMFAHQVGLVYTGVEPRYGLFCSGSLIDAQWVVTAAHCFTEESKAGDLMVYAGSPTLSGGRTVGVVDSPPGIIRFPGYNSENDANDVALVRLKEPVTLAPIPLADSQVEGEILAHTSITTISGWGDIGTGTTGPDRLRFANISTVNRKACEVSYKGHPREISDAVMCASGKSDTCSGDSGGPLAMRSKDNVLRLVGITSFGPDCSSGAPKLPGVYTRVAAFVPWVRCSTARGSACPYWNFSAGDACARRCPVRRVRVRAPGYTGAASRRHGGAHD